MKEYIRDWLMIVMLLLVLAVTLTASMSSRPASVPHDTPKATAPLPPVPDTTQAKPLSPEAFERQHVRQ